jgi:hypothetical protein
VSGSLKTLLWRTAITVALLAIIVGAFYTDQNARGQREWSKIEQAIASRGDLLNWDDYIPALPPSAQNFYEAPMMAEWFVRATAGRAPATGQPLASLLENPETDLEFIDGNSASNYLAWCAVFDSDFRLIREALTRPAARINGDYTKPFTEPVPDFVAYRAVSRVLAHRAKCHLVLGQPRLALDDLTMLHDLSFTLVKDGKPVLLVSSMIHVALMGIYVNVIACGLDAHSWREPDLETLQKQLSEVHLPPLLVCCFQTERAGACRQVDLSADELRRASFPPRSLSDLGWWFMPQGWLNQNKVIVTDLEEQMIESVDLTNQTISPLRSKATVASKEAAFRRNRPWNSLAAWLVPNFVKASEVVARNQTWADQAQIVCGLERYRLRNGQYPPALAALVPQFIDRIPKDIITGKPMRYLRKDDQNFVLYSAGWNEVDDGGTIAHKADGTEDMDNGDWVWHYSEP